MKELRNSVVWQSLVLMRPANLITAIADIMAGFAIGLALDSGGDVWQGLSVHMASLMLLCLSTLGLYGGGVVFNDVFDLELDKEERPERPIPSGAVSKEYAAGLGGILFLLGISAAFYVGKLSGLLAVGIAGLALLYDAKAKHHTLWGPINMAACRGGNLLLGISAFSGSIVESWGFLLLPLLFIGSITLISQGEVGGGNKGHLRLAMIGYSLVMGILVSLSVVYPHKTLEALPFIGLFGLMVFPPLLKAIKSLAPQDVRSAVKMGVISLIILDAALASGFSGWSYGVLILLLLPISIGLAKLFAVT